ncbi:MAG: ATP-grasp domain-containing protein [Actinobacteria bacterium]|nr:ATP-grasp domain-containing protein [Actinomycetota bacterium]
MPTVLVILPTATYRAPDFVGAADELRLDLVVASEEPHALGDLMGERFLVIDCADVGAAADAIVELADRVPLDAIVAADDQGVVVAAVAAERLGLPHNPPAAARATRDKAVMRGLLAAANVPQPRFEVLEGADLAGISIGFPCVVKPLTLSGSRGVIRADDPASLERAVARVRAIQAEAGEGIEAPLLVEEYLPGIEVVVEGLVGPDGVEVLAIFDKPEPMEGPFFEETILVTPSRLGPPMEDEITSVVRRAVEALGVSFGPVHAEVRVEGDRVGVIEIAARSIGGLCSRALRFGLLGTSLEHLLLRAALGMPPRAMRRESRASGVMMLPIPAEGVLRRVGWQGAAMEVPGITALEITVPIGQRVRPLPEGDRYLGFLFAAGDDPDDVAAALREAHGLLQIVIEP